MEIKLNIFLVVLRLCYCYSGPEYYNDDYLAYNENCGQMEREIYLRDRYIMELQNRLQLKHYHAKNRGLISNFDAQAYQYPHEINQVLSSMIHHV